GPCRVSWSDTASGLWGASSGAKIATRTRITMIPPPNQMPTFPDKPGIRPSHRLRATTGPGVSMTTGSATFPSLRGEPHPRIGDHVQNVDHEVDGDEREGEHQGDRLDDGEVLRLNGADQLGTQSIQTERVLDEHRAADQIAGDQSRDREHG